MADTVKYIVTHPKDLLVVKAPPGSSKTVQTIYDAQSAVNFLQAADGLKDVVFKVLPSQAGKKTEIITAKMLDRIGVDKTRQFVYKILRQVGDKMGDKALNIIKGPAALNAIKGARNLEKDAVETAVKELMENDSKLTLRMAQTKIALVADKAAVSASEKAIIEGVSGRFGIALSRMAATANMLDALGPVGLVVDAILMSLQVFGLIYTIFDKTGLSIVMGPKDINGAIETVKKDSEKNLADAGVPSYYSEQAEFPVSSLVFQWDTKSNAYTTTPEWGPMYSGLVDKYMKNQGFSSNWRDLVAAKAKADDAIAPEATPKTNPITSSPLFLLILFIIFLVVLGLIGAAFYFIS